MSNDAKDPVVALDHVLAGDNGQQLGGISSGWPKFVATEQGQGGLGVFHQGIDQGLSG